MTPSGYGEYVYMAQNILKNPLMHNKVVRQKGNKVVKVREDMKAVASTKKSESSQRKLHVSVHESKSA